MKRENLLIRIFGILVLSIMLMSKVELSACSTIMLHKGGELIFGHNLNEKDLGVPGIVFVNKRGVYKMGRSLMEIMTPDENNPSDLVWISRYGSVTCNNFGRDLPDGGMNEVGFYIWEMNEASDYPKKETKQRLSQMGWMQFLLDMCTTVDEALELTKNIEIDGWTWHYFLADASGDCATLAFIDGKMKINRGKNMPVTGLFNTPYDREMDVSKYYENFGGQYKVELDNPKVPRFVKTDWLIKNYDPNQNAVDYGFYMLDKIQVSDEPEWSTIFDVKRKHFYYRTRLNPAIKHFSLDDIDFTSESENILIQNMDTPDAENILAKLHAFNDKEVHDMYIHLSELVGTEFFKMGGLDFETCVDRFVNHWKRALEKENQAFYGEWVSQNDEESRLILKIKSDGNAVSGVVKTSVGEYKMDHITLMNDSLKFTYITSSGTFVEVKAVIKGDTIEAKTYGIEDFYGNYSFGKK